MKKRRALVRPTRTNNTYMTFDRSAHCALLPIVEKFYRPFPSSYIIVPMSMFFPQFIVRNLYWEIVETTKKPKRHITSRSLPGFGEESPRS